MPETVDIAVIGAGTAGMAAYRKAREASDNVALIEGGQYGTTCAMVGCMPSKLLIAAAERADAVRDAAGFGVQAGGLTIDGKAVMERVRDERDRFVGLVRETVEAFDPAHRVTGHATFADPHTIALEDGARLQADRIVVATGSRPVWPSAFEHVGDRLVVNDDIFDWMDLPDSVAVFGGGIIGLELGQALARLGVRVRIFGKGGSVANLTDPVVKARAVSAINKTVPFDPDADVSEIVRDDDAVSVTFAADDDRHTHRFDYLLAATGRKPNVDKLAIDRSGLELDARGVPTFDPLTMQANGSHIFMAGDASARIPLLHEAADDGRIAGTNAASYPNVLAHRRRTPLSVVFTEPNIATVGRSYAELQHMPCEFAVGEVDFADQGRARVMRVNEGVLRVYGEQGTGLFLGAEMIAPRGEHLAHLLSWAAQSRLDVPTMLDMPFYHPVIEEGVRTALRDLCAKLRLRPAPPPRSIDCGPGS